MTERVVCDLIFLVVSFSEKATYADNFASFLCADVNLVRTGMTGTIFEGRNIQTVTSFGGSLGQGRAFAFAFPMPMLK